ASWLLAGEYFLLVREELRQIDLDPAQRRRELHAIRPRVEPGGEIEYRINARAETARDVLIEEIRAHHPGPSVALVHGHRRPDLLAALTRQPPRQWIMEERVAPLRLTRAEDSRPPRCIGDVADERHG